MTQGRSAGVGLFAAADVHYLDCGCARAAAVVAADAGFSQVVSVDASS
jgi:hypothetical protein